MFVVFKTMELVTGWFLSASLGAFTPETVFVWRPKFQHCCFTLAGSHPHLVKRIKVFEWHFYLLACGGAARRSTEHRRISGSVKCNQTWRGTEIWAILRLLCRLWQMCQTNNLQHWAEIEQRTLQSCFCCYAVVYPECPAPSSPSPFCSGSGF